MPFDVLEVAGVSCVGCFEIDIADEDWVRTPTMFKLALQCLLSPSPHTRCAAHKAIASFQNADRGSL